MKECDDDDGDEANTLLVQRITPLVSTSITTTQGNGEGDARERAKGWVGGREALRVLTTREGRG